MADDPKTPAPKPAPGALDPHSGRRTGGVEVIAGGDQKAKPEVSPVIAGDSHGPTPGTHEEAGTAFDSGAAGHELQGRRPAPAAKRTDK